MLTVTLINMLVVIVVVIIHYECLLRLNDWLRGSSCGAGFA